MSGWEHCLTNMLVTYVETKMKVRRRLQQTFLFSSFISTTPARLRLLVVKARERMQWRRRVVRGPMMRGMMTERMMLVSPNPDQGESLTE